MLAPALTVEPAPLVVSFWPKPAVVVEGAGCDEGAEVAGLLNMLGVGAADVVPGADEVAVVPGVGVAVDLAAPNPGNKDPPTGAAAGVDDAAEDVAPPRPGKGEFWGVLDEVAGAPNEGWDAPVVPGVEEKPPSDKAGFGVESAPEEGWLKRDGGCEA